MVRKYAWICLFVLAGLAGCSKSLLAPAPPAVYTDVIARVPTLSTLTLPIQVSVPYLEKTVTSLVPVPLYADNSLEDNDGDHVMYRIELRGPLKMTAAGSTLAITVPLKVWAKAGLVVEKFGFSMAKYEETNFELDASLLSTFKLQSDYKIKSITVPNGYTWIKKPVITVAGLEIPITPILEKVLDANLPKITQQLDAQLGQYLDLKDNAQKAWRLVQEPFLLNPEYSAWLQITPKALYAGQLNGQNGSLSLPLGMAVQARTTVGAKPATIARADVPPLTLQAPSEDGFSITLLCELPWEEARRLALTQFSGQVFTFEGGRTVQVTDLEVYGQGKEMVIGASVTGSLDGKIYLRGTPVFEPKNEAISLAGADFDLQTSNKLAKVAGWAMHGKLQRKMQPFLTFSIAPQLKAGRDLIRKNLAQNALQPGVKLVGTLDTLAPGPIYVTSKGLEVDVAAKGKMGLRVE